MISIVGTQHWDGRTPPRIQRLPSFLGSIVIPCDDIFAEDEGDPHLPLKFRAMTISHSNRIARFVVRTAPKIETLFVHCQQGVSRSAAVGLAIAQAYGVPIQNVEGEPLIPNAHIRNLVSDALRALMSQNRATLDLWIKQGKG